MAPRRILLIDPHDFTRDGLAGALEEEAPDLRAIGRPTVESAPDDPVDLALVRLAAGGHEAITGALDQVRGRIPGVPVAVLPPAVDLETALAALRAGAAGCLSPALDVRHLAHAIRIMIEGGLCVGPVGPHNGAARARSLTAREADVLALLEQGRPNKVIAYELGLSENTVKVHVGRILRKLNAANRTAVASLGPPRP